MDGGAVMPSRPADAVGAALAWLGHPVTVVALVVLVVNDHVLKAASPGWVTGKLSDVAGLVLAPPLVGVLAALLAPRLPAPATVVGGLTAAGAGFTVVKSSEYGAGVASALWSVVNGPSVVRADPTDLIVLPALALAWWVWTRARRRPVGERGSRLARVLVVLPAAVLGVAATSAPQYPHSVAVGEWNGRVVLGQSDGYHGADMIQQWLTTGDDGRTWSAVADPGPAGPAPVEVGQSGCVPDDPRHCYRVMTGRLGVEETVDGGATWRTSWAVSEAARARLAADEYPDLRDLPTWLSSRSLVVRPAATGAYVVLVANGRDGIARREPGGAWERIVFQPYGGAPQVLPGAVAEERTTAARFADLAGLFGLAIFVGCAAFLVAAGLAARRARRTGDVAVFGILMVVAALVLVPAFALTNGMGWFAAVTAAGTVGTGALAALVVVIHTRSVAGRWALRAVGLAVLVVLAVMAPLVAWGTGLLGSYRLAAVLAVSAAAVGLALAVLAGLRAPPPPARKRWPVGPGGVPPAPPMRSAA